MGRKTGYVPAVRPAGLGVSRLTTHDVDDIERLCSRVVVIDQGRIGYDGPIERLRADRDLETVVRELYTGRPIIG